MQVIFTHSRISWNNRSYMRHTVCTYTSFLFLLTAIYAGHNKMWVDTALSSSLGIVSLLNHGKFFCPKTFYTFHILDKTIAITVAYIYFRASFMGYVNTKNNLFLTSFILGGLGTLSYALRMQKQIAMNIPHYIVHFCIFGAWMSYIRGTIETNSSCWSTLYYLQHTLRQVNFVTLFVQ
jgi:hypothetical protein